MATQLYALSEENVSHVKDILAPDIIESPVLDNMEVFNRLRIKVIEDIEYAQTQIIFRRKGGEARRYKEGSTLKSTLGFMDESKLVMNQIWSRYYENLQNFREKQPFSILGSNGTYNAPVTEFILRQIGKQFAGDNLNNLFFGDIELGEDNPLSLYNGYWTIINKLINQGKISSKEGNLVACDPITDSPETQDGENFDAFVEWVEGWHPLLRNAPEVIVYMSQKQKRLITHSYMRKFTGLQTTSAGSEGFSFVGMENIKIVTNGVIGKGNRMIATLPENLQFGLDRASDWNAVMMSHDPNDLNVLIFQVQSTVGARILDIAPSKFCVSDGTIEQIEQLNGDYQKNTLTVTSNNEEWGKVTLSPQKDVYTKDETVKLTPAAESGYKFKAWSDGATISPRDIVYNGYPTYLQAIFEPDDEG
jgi:hypothetical protein